MSTSAAQTLTPCCDTKITVNTAKSEKKQVAQQTAPVIDITRQKWFWEKAVLS